MISWTSLFRNSWYLEKKRIYLHLQENIYVFSIIIWKYIFINPWYINIFPTKIGLTFSHSPVICRTRLIWRFRILLSLCWYKEFKGKEWKAFETVAKEILQIAMLNSVLKGEIQSLACYIAYSNLSNSFDVNLK